MKLKNAVQRSAVIIIILILSVIIGYAYQQVWHKIDIKNHPREYSANVEKYSKEYGVPEYIIYAVILCESNFKSNYLSEDGRIGLMQISPEKFKWLTSMTKEEFDDGMLYDPDTNIKYGTYMLSYLFTKYGRWKSVLAAFETDYQQVDLWMTDTENIDDFGNLVNIPDENISSVVENIEEKVDIYYELYYK